MHAAPRPPRSGPSTVLSMVVPDYTALSKIAAPSNPAGADPAFSTSRHRSSAAAQGQYGAEDCAKQAQAFTHYQIYSHFFHNCKHSQQVGRPRQARPRFTRRFTATERDGPRLRQHLADDSALCYAQDASLLHLVPSGCAALALLVPCSSAVPGP